MKQSVTALWVEGIEGGDYLVSVQATQNSPKVLVRNRDESIKHFKCLSQVKEQVSKKLIADQVYLTEFMPTDEMCGSVSTSTDRFTEVLNWN